MNEEFTYRRAEERDIDFIADTIIESEKSGTDKLSYCTIFSLEEAEFRRILKDILLEDIGGQELCLSGYLIAEANGEYAGACCSWIEGKDGTSSSIIKANILFYFLGEEKSRIADERSELIRKLNFERESGTIQLESGYVTPKYRGKNVCSNIILELIKNEYAKDNTLTKAQMIIAKTNELSYKANHKIGFEIVEERYVEDEEILKLLPSNRMILMENTIEDLEKYW